MKKSSVSGLRKSLALMLIMFGGMTVAYAQQEVSPEWYNPWAPAAAAVASHPAQPALKHQSKKKMTASSQHSGKTHNKRVVAEARPS